MPQNDDLIGYFNQQNKITKDIYDKQLSMREIEAIRKTIYDNSQNLEDDEFHELKIILKSRKRNKVLFWGSIVTILASVVAVAVLYGETKQKFIDIDNIKNNIIKKERVEKIEKKLDTIQELIKKNKIEKEKIEKIEKSLDDIQVLIKKNKHYFR